MNLLEKKYNELSLELLNEDVRDSPLKEQKNKKFRANGHMLHQGEEKELRAN